MSVLTVGQNKQYQTIASAVSAAQNGDTVQVDAGTYSNDFLDFAKDITLIGVGGMVVMTETQQPPNGKAMITESGTVTIQNFDISGVSVPDQNGAAVRYQGGALTLENDYFHNNENGILGAADPNGTIVVDHSEFASNGINGSGSTHNLYIGDIKSFTFENSYSHDANVGHEIKSRAETTIIKDSRIIDHNSTSSYEIDIPNGGVAQITNNQIEQGPNSQNPRIIDFGEEGNLHSNLSLTITGNQILNDQSGAHPAIQNSTGITAQVHSNTIYGLDAGSLVSGSADTSGNTFTNSEPALNNSPGYNPQGTGGTGGGVPPSSNSPFPQATSSNSISITDIRGHHVNVGSIQTGSATWTASNSGLDQSVTQSVGKDGVDTISTPLWNDVRVVNIHDAKGGSYATNAFLEADLSLSGASAGHVLLTNAKRGVVDLQSGNYNVTINAHSNAADPKDSNGNTQHLNDFVITTGSGNNTVVLHGDGTLTHGVFTSGSGHNVLVGANGGNQVTFGSGRTEVTGGTGADNYVYHANSGVDIIQNYDKNMDSITVDSSLKSSLHVSHGAEGTTLMFGSSQHELVLHAIQNFDPGLIHWN